MRDQGGDISLASHSAQSGRAVAQSPSLWAGHSTMVTNTFTNNNNNNNNNSLHNVGNLTLPVLELDTVLQQLGQYLLGIFLTVIYLQ